MKSNSRARKCTTCVIGVVVLLSLNAPLRATDETEPVVKRFAEVSAKHSWRVPLSCGGAAVLLNPASGEFDAWFFSRVYRKIEGFNNCAFGGISPDGQQLVQGIMLRGKPTILIYSVTDNKPKTIDVDSLLPGKISFRPAEQRAAVKELYLSPDEQKLAYAVLISDTGKDNPQRHGFFCVSDLKTGKSDVLSEVSIAFMKKFRLLGNVWSPDSAALLFPATDDTVGIHRLDLVPKNALSIPADRACWSPTKNDVIWFLQADGAVMRHELASGKRTEVGRLPAPQAIRQIVVTPDEQFVLFVSETSSTPPTISVMDVATGKNGLLKEVRDGMLPFISVGKN